MPADRNRRNSQKEKKDKEGVKEAVAGNAIEEEKVPEVQEVDGTTGNAIIRNLPGGDDAAGNQLENQGGIQALLNSSDLVSDSELNQIQQTGIVNNQNVLNPNQLNQNEEDQSM